MPLIDLTGGSPGASVILSAKTPGKHWLLGGYPGSLEATTLALSLAEKEDIRNSWIITAPMGTREIPVSALNNLNIDFPNSYTKTGAVITGHRNEVQILWKPKK